MRPLVRHSQAGYWIPAFAEITDSDGEWHMATHRAEKSELLMHTRELGDCMACPRCTIAQHQLRKFKGLASKSPACGAHHRLSQPRMGAALLRAPVPQRIDMHGRHVKRQRPQYQLVCDAGDPDKVARQHG